MNDWLIDWLNQFHFQSFIPRNYCHHSYRFLHSNHYLSSVNNLFRIFPQTFFFKWIIIIIESSINNWQKSICFNDDHHCVTNKWTTHNCCSDCLYIWYNRITFAWRCVWRICFSKRFIVQNGHYCSHIFQWDFPKKKFFSDSNFRHIFSKIIIISFVVLKFKKLKIKMW